MELSRQRLGEGPKRGDLTGPNPTDRAKSGAKRHILTDGRGVPIAALISGANVPDATMISEVLAAVIMRGPRGPRRPEHLCLDKGYDYPHVAPADSSPRNSTAHPTAWRATRIGSEGRVSSQCRTDALDPCAAPLVAELAASEFQVDFFDFYVAA